MGDRGSPGRRGVGGPQVILSIRELTIEDVDVKDDVRMASRWRGISIHGHITPFARRL